MHHLQASRAQRPVVCWTLTENQPLPAPSTSQRLGSGLICPHCTDGQTEAERGWRPILQTDAAWCQARSCGPPADSWYHRDPWDEGEYPLSFPFPSLSPLLLPLPANQQKARISVLLSDSQLDLTLTWQKHIKCSSPSRTGTLFVPWGCGIYPSLMLGALWVLVLIAWLLQPCGSFAAVRWPSFSTATWFPGAQGRSPLCGPGLLCVWQSWTLALSGDQCPPIRSEVTHS